MFYEVHICNNYVVFDLSGIAKVRKYSEII